MRTTFAFLLLFVAGILLSDSASTARAQILGVFADANGTDCDATIPQLRQTTLYVLALLGGPAAEGIQAAQFRIDGVPPTWFATWIAPVGCDFCMNPLQGGAYVTWPSCQAGTAGVVLVGLVQLFLVDRRENVYLQVRGPTIPSHPERPGPLVTLCDGPIWTAVDVGTTDFILNGAPCTIAVQPSSWSLVKSLFD